MCESSALYLLGTREAGWCAAAGHGLRQICGSMPTLHYTIMQLTQSQVVTLSSQVAAYLAPWCSHPPPWRRLFIIIIKTDCQKVPCTDPLCPSEIHSNSPDFVIWLCFSWWCHSCSSLSPMATLPHSAGHPVLEGRRPSKLCLLALVVVFPSPHNGHCYQTQPRSCIFPERKVFNFFC